MDSHSCQSKFECLPLEIRWKIYRELLVAERFSVIGEFALDPTYDDESIRLEPAILRVNKKIHDEAAAILYEENYFQFSVLGVRPQKLWHNNMSTKTRITRRYSRLMKYFFLDINFRGNDNDPSMRAIDEAFDVLKANIDKIADKLSLNDLKYLEVQFINSYTGGPTMISYGQLGRFGAKPYVGEFCLEPLKKVRAEQFKINSHASPKWAAVLKAVIEGPKDKGFRAHRQRIDQGEESDFDDVEPWAGSKSDSEEDADN